MEDYSDDHLDHSFEVGVGVVKKRAVQGIAVLMGRGFFLNIVAQVSQFFLLAFLSPSEMGVFWIVTAAVGFLVFFSDVGLAAALIQKKEKLTNAELKTTFLVQQTLVVLLVLILFAGNSFIAGVYDLDNEGKLLLFALGISFFLSSLKSIPSVLLERKLEFGKFVIPELVESLVYSFVAVILAWQGFGVRSFTYAVLLRGIVGVMAMYIIQPWRPGFAFSKKALGGLFRFGVPYQFNTLVAVVKDRGVTLALGAVVGTTGVGFLGTAERVAQVPLRLFMDPVTRVTFPAFSRMQGHRSELGATVTKTLQFITFATFPAVIGFWLVAPQILEVFPRYQKWEPSLVPLGFLVVNVLFASFTTQITNVLMAIGKIKVVTKLIIMWTVLTLIFVPGLGMLYGINGAAAGYAIVSVSSVIAVYIGRRYVDFSLWASVGKVSISTILMALAVVGMRGLLEADLVSLILTIVAGAAVYAMSSYLVIGKSLLTDAKKITGNFFGG